MRISQQKHDVETTVGHINVDATPWGKDVNTTMLFYVDMNQIQFKVLNIN